MITVYIGQKCEEKGFETLINFLGPKCKEFSFKGSLRIKNSSFKRLKPFYLRTEYIKFWPGTKTLYPDPDGYPVMYFQVSQESIKTLFEVLASLYQWKCIDKGDYPPENLGFYRKDGRQLLGTISHERYGWLKLEVGELEKLKPILEEHGIKYTTDPKWNWENL